MPIPHPLLSTPRLTLRPAVAEDAPEILDYYRRNQAHLERWEPARKPEFYTAEFWAAQISADHANWEADRGYRLYLFANDAPSRVAGMAHLSNVVRGVAQYANLGYSLDGALEGRGLMTEALGALIPWAFDAVRLHRLMANYVPGNARSGALLERFGFEREGLARKYIRINGTWEDHVLTALTNEEWREGE